MAIKRRDERKHDAPRNRFEWEKLLGRAELPHATKLVGLLMAGFGDPDGTNVKVSERRLAVSCDWSEKYISQQIDLLRSKGMLERVKPGYPDHAAVYRLTLPGEGFDPVPMRVDPDGHRRGEKPKGRGGRKPKETRTPVPVSEGEDQNSSSGVAPDDRNSSSGLEESDPNSTSGVEEGAGTGSELEFQQTRTGVPSDPNCSSPNHVLPTFTKPMSGSYSSPTSNSGRSEEPHEDQSEAGHGAEADTTPSRVADLDYVRAQKFMNTIPPALRDSAVTDARDQLAAEGAVINVRALTVRAALLLQTRDTA